MRQQVRPVGGKTIRFRDLHQPFLNTKAKTDEIDLRHIQFRLSQNPQNRLLSRRIKPLFLAQVIRHALCARSKQDQANPEA
ncbi:hypothetical protein TH5_20735 [Thalassospira xianhensis MCCC 1A02616]|uniref:Uncharacterized protein n=1 Tax=Thalassospira xianhensis MCCC 1A02616 TaxID=1177929 RepID=A0A367U7L7_9PROT|nr:hypothetical protein TH5_20735 [Thalassospira xianhensis MCCC 1A02616]